MVQASQRFPLMNRPFNAKQVAYMRGLLLLGVCLLLSNRAHAQAGPSVIEGGQHSVAEPLAPAPLQQLAQAQPLAVVNFDALFFRNTPYAHVDVSRFARGQAVLPGRYELAVFVNGLWRQDLSVRFASDEVGLCLDQALLQAWQLQAQVLQQALLKQVQFQDCAPMAAVLAGATYTVSLPQLRLDVLIPQALLANVPEGYIAPEQWAGGDAAAFVNYHASHYEQRRDGRRWQSESVGIRAGLSAHGWALRHNGYYTKAATEGGGYRSDGVYLQTDVAALRAQLKLGTFYTASHRLEGFKIKGVQLASDERMLPPQWRGYAPTVRGYARSNARVTVRQQGQIIHEATVPPGAFAIADLYPLGYAGNLTVTVTEADGREEVFIVPFAEGVQLLRPGHARYSVALGEVPDEFGPQAWLWQSAWQYGLSNRTTVNAAWQQHQQHRQGVLGLSFNTALGAIGLDHSRSRSVYGLGEVQQGHFWQLNYAKRLGASQTSIYARAARYSASGSHRLADFLRDRQQGLGNRHLRPKSDWQVTINQGWAAAKWGQVYATATQSSSWATTQRQTSLQLGYANQYRQLSYSLNASQSQDGDSGGRRRQLTLSVSLPLSVSRPLQTLRFSHGYDHSPVRQHDTQLAYSDSIGQRNQLGYGGAINRQAGATLYSGYASHQGSLGNLSLSASQAKGDRQAAIGMQGAVVIHPQGLLLAPSVGDSFVIIHAPGAAGAHINNYPGTYLNALGQGVVPYVLPYELNHVGIDPQGIDYRVVLAQTEKRLVPRGSGASVVRFTAEIGWPVLFTLASTEALAVPVGAEVIDERGVIISMVGPGGRLYIQNAQPQGRFWVRWARAGEQQACVVDYDSAMLPRADAMLRQTVVCVPEEQERKHVSVD